METRPVLCSTFARGLLLGSALAIMAGCAANRTQSIPSPSNAMSNNPNAALNSVAVFGDNRGELSAQIAGARAQHEYPVYLTIQAPKRQYVFPVYAQVLRSANGLIVLAYNKLFVFRVGDSRLYYGDNKQDLPASELPIVRAPVIEAAAALKQPGAFTSGDTAVKRQACPDCVVVLAAPQAVANVAQKWTGVSDPWQINPKYVSYKPPAGGTRPMNDGTGDSCTSYPWTDYTTGTTWTITFCYYSGGYREFSNGGYQTARGGQYYKTTPPCIQQDGAWVSPTGSMYCLVAGPGGSYVVESGTPVGF